VRPYSERLRPPRDQAPMPPEALARKPWLLILPAVLVSPFSVRKNGPLRPEVAWSRTLDTFHRLLRFGGTVKERILPVWKSWKSAEPQFKRGLQWLKLRLRFVFWVAGIGSLSPCLSAL
jgi:hypothetical protein